MDGWMENQLDTLRVDKVDEKAAVTDVDVQKDSNIRKKEDKNLEIPDCERDNRQERDNTGHWIVPPKVRCG